jgi:hypothetical protein
MADFLKGESAGTTARVAVKFAQALAFLALSRLKVGRYSPAGPGRPAPGETAPPIHLSNNPIIH